MAGVPMRSACAINDPGTTPAIMAASEKGGEGWFGSRQFSPVAAAVSGPLIPATDGQFPSLRRAGPGFHGTRDAAFLPFHALAARRILAG